MFRAPRPCWQQTRSISLGLPGTWMQRVARQTLRSAWEARQRQQAVAKAAKVHWSTKATAAPAQPNIHAVCGSKSRTLSSNAADLGQFGGQ
eukprot:9956348-Alexandrium_andersonii.AAC.1